MNVCKSQIKESTTSVCQAFSLVKMCFIHATIYSVCSMQLQSLVSPVDTAYSQSLKAVLFHEYLFPWLTQECYSFKILLDVLKYEEYCYNVIGDFKTETSFWVFRAVLPSFRVNHASRRAGTSHHTITVETDHSEPGSVWEDQRQIEVTVESPQSSIVVKIRPQQIILSHPQIEYEAFNNFFPKLKVKAGVFIRRQIMEIIDFMEYSDGESSMERLCSSGSLFKVITISKWSMSRHQ